MSGFSQENVETIFTQAGESLSALADSLNQCFDFQYRLEMGESGVWSPEEMSEVSRDLDWLPCFAWVARRWLV